MSLIGAYIKTDELEGYYPWGATIRLNPASREGWAATAFTESAAIKDLLNKIQLSKDPSKQALANLRIQNPRRTYDPKCFELAAAFIEDSDCPITDSSIHELAAAIQDTIETFISDLESK